MHLEYAPVLGKKQLARALNGQKTLERVAPAAKGHEYRSLTRGKSAFKVTPEDLDRTSIIRDGRDGSAWLQMPVAYLDREGNGGKGRYHKLAAPAGITSIDSASTVFMTIYEELLGGVSGGGIVTELTREVPIDGKILAIPAMTGTPRLRKQDGSARQFKNGRVFVQSATLASYEVSTEIRRIDVDYDRSGVVNSWLDMFLGQAKRAIDDLLTGLYLVNGWLGYDATALLSAAHPFSNLTGNNLTNQPVNYSTYKAALQSMELFADEFGTIFNADFEDQVLLVGPLSRRVAQEVTQAEFRGQPVSSTGQLDGSSGNVATTAIPNVFAGAAQTMVTPWFGGNQWMLTTRAAGQRPFVLGVGRMLEPIIQIAMDGDARFLLDNYRFGLDGDLAPAPGPWPIVYGSTTA